MADEDRLGRCNHCKQPLVEIDNRGQRLTGYLTCNLWAPADGKRWTRLSEEDLRALHRLRYREERAPAEADAPLEAAARYAVEEGPRSCLMH